MAHSGVWLDAWARRLLDALRKARNRGAKEDGPRVDTGNRPEIGKLKGPRVVREVNICPPAEVAALVEAIKGQELTDAERRLKAHVAALERDYPRTRPRRSNPNQHEDVSGWDPWGTGNRR